MGGLRSQFEVLDPKYIKVRKVKLFPFLYKYSPKAGGIYAHTSTVIVGGRDFVWGIYGGSIIYHRCTKIQLQIIHL